MNPAAPTRIATAARAADDDVLLNEREVADMLGLSHRTLQTWRCLGVGPAVVRLGRRRLYRAGDLRRFIADNTAPATVRGERRDYRAETATGGHRPAA